MISFGDGFGERKDLGLLRADLLFRLGGRQWVDQRLVVETLQIRPRATGRLDDVRELDVLDRVERRQPRLQQPVRLLEFLADLADGRFVDGCVYLRTHVIRASPPSRVR